MKKNTLYLLVAGLSLLTACHTEKSAGTDPVADANKRNQARAYDPGFNIDAADFLVEATDARLMGIREGRQAMKKGTTSDIRAYGSLMVTDQTKMLSEIRTIAGKQRISLPSGIGSDKQDGLKDLQAKKGAAFDKTFARMMKIDHERDVKKFAKAKTLNDSDVSGFAAARADLIQTHLDKINAISDKLP